MTPDPNILADGDSLFLGVDQRTDPAQLRPGYVSDAKNCRFHNGIVETRPGNVIRPIGPGVAGLLPYDRPQGAVVFKDPNGAQWFVIAHQGTVKRAGTHQTGEAVTLPSGVNLDDGALWQPFLNFTQAFNKLILWRGADNAPLEMENFADGFQTITQATSGSGNGTGTLTIPNADRGTFFQNRVWAVSGDNLYVSDALNYTRYSLFNQFRINDGSDDRLLNFLPFGADSGVAFKTKSVHFLANLVPDAQGDLSYATRETMTSQHGLVSADAVAQVGRDLFYLSTEGVTSVRLTEENRVKAVELPLSWGMLDWWERIHWRYAARSQMAYWDSKLYVAVPTEDSTVPNTVAVFDFRKREWSGTDEGDGYVFGVLRFLPAFYNGKLRLFFLDYNGLVRLMEEGYDDERQGDFLLWEDGARQLWETGLPKLTDDLTIYQTAFTGEVLTRGYTGGVEARKRFYNVRPQVATFNPMFSLTANVEGVNETETLLTNQTRSRTRYSTFATADWDPTDGATHGSKFREDYSVALPGGGMSLPAAGVDLTRHQIWEQPRTVRGRGRYLQLRLSNTQGRAHLRSVTLNAAITDTHHLALT